MTEQYLVVQLDTADGWVLNIDPCRSLDDAVEAVDQMAEETAKQQSRGRVPLSEFKIFTMVEVPEAVLWDWSFLRPEEQNSPGQTIYPYTSERAARNSMWAGCQLIRRRRGHDNPWQEVTE